MEKTILTRESGHCPFKLLKKLFCYFTGKLDSLELQKHIIFKISFNRHLSGEEQDPDPYKNKFSKNNNDSYQLP